jgi:hypothetical protein
MYTLPFRLTLWQCIHSFLTADRTFIPRICVAAMDVDGGMAIDWEGRMDGIGWKIGRCWMRGRIRVRNIVEIGH